MIPTFRFAPSPNGYLHLGHALSALLNGEAATALEGRFLLRIEDIDTSRCRPEFEQAIREDLHWLGLNWEEPVRHQSEHFALYREALSRLDALGLVYASFDSRAEIAARVAAREAAGIPWPRDPDGAPLYPGHRTDISDDERTRRQSAGEPFALRLDIAAALALAGPLDWHEEGEGAVAADPARWGDVILARKETPTSYHLSVVIDDALQGISHIVRGRDLYEATAVHRLLQTLLDLPQPTYHHHRLILDADGRKLSKSSASTALRQLRADGFCPDDIRRMIGLMA